MRINVSKIDYTFIENYRGNDHPNLSNIYHKGQKYIWDGEKTLESLIAKHGLIKLPENKRIALSKILSLIVWGEYAAWQTSSILAFELNDFNAKMAATSQVHDEARHFYVMCDYLERVLGISLNNTKISEDSKRGLDTIIGVSSLSKRLLGMQLMVEPVAITIFRLLQKADIEPILTELLSLYIKDESRHIALGVKHLPVEIKKLSWYQLIDLFLWQSKLLKYEIDGLLDLKPSLDCIGIDYKELFIEAEQRQIDAAKEMLEVLGWNIPIDSIIRKITRTYIKLKT